MVAKGTSNDMCTHVPAIHWNLVAWVEIMNDSAWNCFIHIVTVCLWALLCFIHAYCNLRMPMHDHASSCKTMHAHACPCMPTWSHMWSSFMLHAWVNHLFRPAGKPVNLRKVSVPWMRMRCPNGGSCSRSSQKVTCNKRLGSCDALIHACFACYLQPTLFKGVHVPRLFISDQLSRGATHVMSPNCHLHACRFEHPERPEWIFSGQVSQHGKMKIS